MSVKDNKGPDVGPWVQAIERALRSEGPDGVFGLVWSEILSRTKCWLPTCASPINYFYLIAHGRDDVWNFRHLL